MIAAGQAQSAYVQAQKGGTNKIWGTDWAYFTKWFWAVSLALPGLNPQPLILDSRVINTLSTFHLPDFGSPTSARWVTYLTNCRLWAGKLSGHLQGHPPIDAEKIEYLLWYLG
jgi:hypothetical protein